MLECKEIADEVQVAVVGWQFGAWGLENYGSRPRKVDALEFHTRRLEQLWKMVTEHQQQARTQYAPAAFVTFRTRRAQVTPDGCSNHLPLLNRCLPGFCTLIKALRSRDHSRLHYPMIPVTCHRSCHHVDPKAGAIGKDDTCAPLTLV